MHVGNRRRRLKESGVVYTGIVGAQTWTLGREDLVKVRCEGRTRGHEDWLRRVGVGTGR